jgi:hypothetical protein
VDRSRSLLSVLLPLHVTQLVSHVHARLTDAHAIYLLNLLLAFLQPKFDPSLQDDLLADEIEEGGEDNAPTLPSSRDDEFRPFVRRLPEWQFWFVRSFVVFSTVVLHSVQVIVYESNVGGDWVHGLRGIRRTGVLASLGGILFGALCAHYETSDSVRCPATIRRAIVN